MAVAKAVGLKEKVDDHINKAQAEIIEFLTFLDRENLWENFNPKTRHKLNDLQGLVGYNKKFDGLASEGKLKESEDFVNDFIEFLRDVRRLISKLNSLRKPPEGEMSEDTARKEKQLLDSIENLNKSTIPALEESEKLLGYIVAGEVKKKTGEKLTEDAALAVLIVFIAGFGTIKFLQIRAGVGTVTTGLAASLPFLPISASMFELLYVIVFSVIIGIYIFYKLMKKWNKI